MPVTVAGKGVALAVLKKAEKDECLVIRLVETHGCATTASVTLSDPDARLVETNLMEWTTEKDLGQGIIQIPMRAFDIRTFKIV